MQGLGRVLHLLLLLGAVVVMLASSAADARSIKDRVKGEDNPPRDLFDQMIHSLAAKYLRLPPTTAGPQLQWSVHPLPRAKRQLNLAPASAAAAAAASSDAGGDDDGGASSIGGILGGGGGGGGGGNAIPASVLAAAASASPSGSAGGSAPSATGSASASSDRSASSASAASSTPPSSSSAPTSSAAPSSATPLSKLINTNAGTSSSSSSSSSTSSTATPTPPPPANQASSPSLLSPKHKFFPLVVAGLAAAGLLALMLLIAIARCIAHDQLRRDNLAKSYSFDDPSSSSSSFSKDKFTAAPRRSIRRALTKKKLGSFARRTQDGSVLIEVGDEVFAVPPHLAGSYREKLLREKRSKSEMSIREGGMWGNVQPKWLTDGGPDEEEAGARYDDMLQGGGKAGVGRSLSQRLGERLRSLTATQPMPTLGEERRPVAERNAYSFSSQHQLAGAMRQIDLAKTGIVSGPPGWQIQQRQSSASYDAQQQPAPREPPPKPKSHSYGTATITNRSTIPSAPVVKPTRKPAPKLELSLLTEKLADLEKQSATSSTSSSKLPSEARLTTSSSSCGTFGDSSSAATEKTEKSFPGAFPERTKSLHRNKSVKPLILDASTAIGGYRHRPPAAASRSKTLHPDPQRAKLDRKHTSVPLASPTRFTHEAASPLVVHPQRPPPTATNIRPLPVPPPFNLPK